MDVTAMRITAPGTAHVPVAATPPPARDSGAASGGGGIGGSLGQFLARFTTPQAAIVGGSIGAAVGFVLGSVPGAAIGAAAGAALGAAVLRMGPTGPGGQPFGDWYHGLSPEDRDRADRFFSALSARDSGRA